MEANSSSWKKIWIAILHVLKMAISPVSPLLSFGEVSKLLVLLLAIGIDLGFLLNWYAVICVITLLLLIAAVRIQMQFRSEEEIQNNYNKLQDLYATGVVLRNSYQNRNIDEETIKVIDCKCEEWENSLLLIIESSFPKYKTLFKPLMNVSRIKIKGLPEKIRLKTFREHNERLERLKIFFEEYRQQN